MRARVGRANAGRAPGDLEDPGRPGAPQRAVLVMDAEGSLTAGRRAVIGLDLLAHRPRILRSVGPERKFPQDLRHVLEGERAVGAVEPIVLQPYRQRAARRKLLSRDGVLRTFSAVVEQVEPLHEGTIVLREELVAAGRQLPAEQTPRLVRLRQEPLPVA